MYRLISLLIGYVLGGFLTAELVSKQVSGKSVFDIGTGNPGMANIVNQYGVKYGIVVLAGDLLKTFVPCLLCRMILFPDLGAAAAAYAGVGAVLGHNFPIWHRLKGGKGVACTCAALVSISFGYGLQYVLHRFWMQDVGHASRVSATKNGVAIYQRASLG